MAKSLVLNTTDGKSSDPIQKSLRQATSPPEKVPYAPPFRAFWR
jgi:hypothetical protein